ncbi:hypothetical protein O6H91_23G059400 [Diphasiastrum complanatum]|uniref:Uncharacterized protein n=1 Tax=Diphasiastrum complanatum TaxID=34168 RepID=A0ACC2ABA2_DIPCM|nr:hypothetical protein O6H91_23G059400 [Diphasiastrum complanatum]
MMSFGDFASIQQQHPCNRDLFKRKGEDPMLTARSGVFPDYLMPACDFSAQLPTIAECAEEFFACNKMDSGDQPKSASVSAEGTYTESSSGFSGDSAVHDLYVKGKGYRPRAFLSLFSSFCNCWHQKAQEADGMPNASVEALVELSRRQQEELADKQDTIDMLEWQLQQLQAMARKEHELQDDMKSSERGNKSPPLSPGFNTAELLFEMTTIRSIISIRFFCKVFMKQMEISGYSIWRALAELEPRTTFLRKEHTAFALESRINKALFHSFENDSFDETGLTQILDPCNRSIVRMEQFKRMKLMDVGEAVNPNHSAFDPDFFKFCESKTREMWALFPWSIIFKSSEERAVFTASFLDAAKGVWLLHRLAFSMNPEIGIIRVGRCMELNPTFVEAVVDLPAICNKCQASRVEFMIMPGFRSLKPMKCQVYPHVQCK